MKESEVSMKCPVCQKPIETVSSADELDEFKINGEPVHEDCYWEEFGKGIEEHPICTPRILRGG